MRSTSLAILIVVATGASFGQTVKTLSIAAPKIVIPAEGIRMPMTARGGRPVVTAKVNGKGPFRFYFDTGASGPVISNALAKELKLTMVGEVQVLSGGDAPGKKPIPGKLVRIDRLEMGTAIVEGATVAAMDRARLEGEDSPIGVLSPAMFPGYLVTLDYPRKEIKFRVGELPVPDNKTVFAYLARTPIPSLMVEIGGETIEAHLDSGSGAGLSLPTKLAERLPLQGKLIDSRKKARSVSGDFPVFEGKLKGKCSFGQFTLTDPTIAFTDVVRHANLGSRILERFTLTIDVKNRRFQLLGEGERHEIRQDS
jgi:hypothetical protein